jgi:dihydroorotase
MGMTGLETALPVIQHAMVDTGLLDWHGVARVMSANPARIYRHADQGQLNNIGGLVEGAVANIAVYDPQHIFTVNPSEHASKSTNSPYRGMELSGQVTDVFYRGHQVVADANLTTPYRHN